MVTSTFSNSKNKGFERSLVRGYKITNEHPRSQLAIAHHYISKNSNRIELLNLVTKITHGDNNNNNKGIEPEFGDNKNSQQQQQERYRTIVHLWSQRTTQNSQLTTTFNDINKNKNGIKRSKFVRTRTTHSNNKKNGIEPFSSSVWTLHTIRSTEINPQFLPLSLLSSTTPSLVLSL